MSKLNDRHLNRINELSKDILKYADEFVPFNELCVTISKELLVQLQNTRDSLEVIYIYPLYEGGLQLETETINKRYTFECQVHNSGKIICSFYNLHVYETETEDEDDDVEMLEFESKSVESVMSWINLKLILLEKK